MARKNRVSRENKDAPVSNKDFDDTEDREDGSRRELLKVVVAAGVGLCAVGTPICAGTRMILAPVFQEGRTGKFYPLAGLDSLTETPRKFFIVDEKRDAWMNTPDQKLGSVFLRKSGDQVVALHSLCPHAGCMIQAGVKKNPETGNEEPLFHCPCHAALFDLDGRRLNEASPRDLDSLEVRIEENTVYVRFENFLFGIAEKRNG